MPAGGATATGRIEPNRARRRGFRSRAGALVYLDRAAELVRRSGRVSHLSCAPHVHEHSSTVWLSHARGLATRRPSITAAGTASCRSCSLVRWESCTASPRRRRHEAFRAPTTCRSRARRSITMRGGSGTSTRVLVQDLRHHPGVGSQVAIAVHAQDLARRALIAKERCHEWRDARILETPKARAPFNSHVADRIVVIDEFQLLHPLRAEHPVKIRRNGATKIAFVHATPPSRRPCT